MQTNLAPRFKKIKSGSVEKKWTPLKIVMFIVLVLYISTLLGAIVWAFLTSLKGRVEYIRDAIALPKDWKFSNYIQAFTELQAGGKSVWVMLLNSVWLSMLPPTINLLTAAMASYIMAKYKFPGRDVIWGIMIVMMTLPVMGNSAAVYKLYFKLGMYNTPLILLRNITGLGGSMFLIAAFKGQSKTYMEAAFIEGAGHFRVFWQIMMPQIIGVLSALWVMAFISAWNDYMTPLMYLPSFTPITTGLYIYQKESEVLLNIPVLFAGSLMELLVPVALFAIFNDKFMQLSYGGGIKS